MRVTPSVLIIFLLLASGSTPGAKSPRALSVGGAALGTSEESACGGSWETYISRGDEFSVALPEMPALDYSSRGVRGSPTKTERVRVFGAYGDGVVYVLRAYDKPRPNEDLDYFADYFAFDYNYPTRPVPYASRADLALGKFAGRRYRIEKDRIPEGIARSSLYVYLTTSHAYLLFVVGADESHPCVQNFLKSFSLSAAPQGRQIFDEPMPARQEASAAPTPTQPGKSDPPAAEPPTKPVDSDRAFRGSEVTRKAIIVSRPEPPYTESARRNQVTGAARLRMILSSDGTVNGLTVVRRLPDGLTESALRAARHIKFVPAEKDGRRVSQYVTIDYNFNIY